MNLKSIGKALSCGLLCLSILLTFAGRIRLLSAPLERDEGEFAYMGRLLLEGTAPYGTAANMKLPGTSAAYAAIMALFGQSVTAIHLGLLLANLATCVLIFFLGRRLLGNVTAGLVAASGYVVLTSGWSILGFWAHATHFVVLPAMAAILLLLRWNESQRWVTLFASGLLFGIAFLMKQHGIAFALFGAGYILAGGRRRSIPSMGLFGAAVALPFAVTCLALWFVGVFGPFWFWTFTYAREYASVTSLSEGWESLRNGVSTVLQTNQVVWGLASVGLGLLLVRWKQSPTARFVCVLAAFSFLAICPGFHFREHYFVLLMPAAALCLGAFVTVVPRLTIWLAAAGLLFSVFQQANILFEVTPNELVRTVYASNPFVQVQEVASYIRANAEPSDEVLVFGSEPEILFYSERHTATPFLYTYPLMEAHPYAAKMQADFIRSVEANRPMYAVVVNMPASWLADADSNPHLLQWWNEYAPKHYRQVGLVDIFANQSVSHWGPGYKPESSSYLLVLKRAD